jgi:hypothetical protein
MAGFRARVGAVNLEEDDMALTDMVTVAGGRRITLEQLLVSMDAQVAVIRDEMGDRVWGHRLRIGTAGVSTLPAGELMRYADVSATQAREEATAARAEASGLRTAFEALAAAVRDGQDLDVPALLADVRRTVLDALDEGVVDVDITVTGRPGTEPADTDAQEG